MASMTTAALSGALNEGKQLDPCYNILHDVWDTVLLTTLFIIGWMVCNPNVLGSLVNASRRRSDKVQRETALVPPRETEEEDCQKQVEDVRLDDVKEKVNLSAQDSDNVESELIALASRYNICSCFQLWRSLPCSTVLSGATCDALAAVLRRWPGLGASEVEVAIKAAEASKSAELAEVMLTAGARPCGAAWVVDWAARLRDAGIAVGTTYLTELARAYCNGGRVDLAVDLWAETCVAQGGALGDEDDATLPGPLPAAELYGAVLDCCIGSGDFESALRLARLSGWRAPPGPGSNGKGALLALARWLAKRQDSVLGRKCIDAVRFIGGAVDLATLRSVLITSVRSADMMQASSIFNDILSSGLKPDFATYSAMIRGYCAIGNVEEAMVHFQQMRAQGIVPDVHLFDGLLDGCTSRNMLDLTQQVLADMAALELPPSNTTLAILARFHGQRGELEKSIALFKELPNGLTVNAHAYGALVAACLGAGRTDLALEAFEEMRCAGCQASARTYEDLIRDCMRRGHLDRAVDLVDDALGLTSVEAAGPRVRRAILEMSLLTDLLRLVCRRRQAQRLGAPLVERLEMVGIPLPEQVAEAVLRCAKGSSEGPRSSTLELRRCERRRWLDFSSTSAVVTAC